MKNKKIVLLLVKFHQQFQKAILFDQSYPLKVKTVAIPILFIVTKAHKIIFPIPNSSIVAGVFHGQKDMGICKKKCILLLMIFITSNR